MFNRVILIVLLLLTPVVTFSKSNKLFKIGEYNGYPVYYHESASVIKSDSCRSFEIAYKKLKFTGTTCNIAEEISEVINLKYQGKYMNKILKGAISNSHVSLRYGSKSLIGSYKVKRDKIVYKIDKGNLKIKGESLFVKEYDYRIPDTKYSFKFGNRSLRGDNITSKYRGTLTAEELFIFIIIMKFEHSVTIY